MEPALAWDESWRKICKRQICNKQKQPELPLVKVKPTGSMTGGVVYNVVEVTAKKSCTRLSKSYPTDINSSYYSPFFFR